MLSPIDIVTAGPRLSLEPIRFSKIAAGCSSIGAHSMAIDQSGRLYGWGVAYAAGLGVVKAILSPTHVPVATRPLATQSEGANDGTEADVAEEDDVDYEYLEDQQVDPDRLGVSGTAPHHRERFSAEQRREVVDVACGGGFTVCVTKSGQVYTWGVWAHGRLGKLCSPFLFCSSVFLFEISERDSTSVPVVIRSWSCSSNPEASWPVSWLREESRQISAPPAKVTSWLHFVRIICMIHTCIPHSV